MTRYHITFDVVALTRWGAIEGAITRVRTGVKVNDVFACEEVAPGMWKVTLSVAEAA